MTPPRLISRRLVGTMLLSLSLLACSSDHTTRWQEDVMLSDGRVITVVREEVTCCGTLAEPGGAARSYALDYAPLNLHWHNSWEYPLMSFDLIDGVPWIAAAIVNEKMCQGQAPTKLAATYFKWTGTAWREVPEEEFPLDKAKKNLLSGYPNPRGKERDHVPVELKGLSVPPLTVRDNLTQRSFYCRRFKSQVSLGSRVDRHRIPFASRHGAAKAGGRWVTAA